MLGWFRALMPREDRFFDLFRQHAGTLVAGASALEKLLEGGDGIPGYCERIVVEENKADEITREVMLAVRRSFITPFDRGDIKDLIMSMDDAIDQMNKTVKTITLFEVRSFEPSMLEMGRIILQAAKLTQGAVPLLQTMGKDGARLGSYAEEIIRIEGRADEIHDEGLKALFRAHGRTDAMSYIIGSEIYGSLEKIVDRFEDVANEINGIVIEHV